MTTLGRRMNRRQDRCNLLGLCLTLGSRNGHHNQNRSKLLGLLLAGFSPRPSNLGCSWAQAASKTGTPCSAP